MNPKDANFIAFQLKGASDLVKNAMQSYKKALEDAYTAKVGNNKNLGVLSSKLEYSRALLFNQMKNLEEIAVKYHGTVA